MNQDEPKITSGYMRIEGQEDAAEALETVTTALTVEDRADAEETDKALELIKMLVPAEPVEPDSTGIAFLKALGAFKLPWYMTAVKEESEPVVRVNTGTREAARRKRQLDKGQLSFRQTATPRVYA